MAVNLIVIAITCLMTGFIVVWFGPSPSRRRRICGPSAELTDCRSASERVSDCRMSMPIPCEQMPRPSLEQGRSPAAKIRLSVAYVIRSAAGGEWLFF